MAYVSLVGCVMYVRRARNVRNVRFVDILRIVSYVGFVRLVGFLCGWVVACGVVGVGALSAIYVYALTCA